MLAAAAQQEERKRANSARRESLLRELEHEQARAARAASRHAAQTPERGVPRAVPLGAPLGAATPARAVLQPPEGPRAAAPTPPSGGVGEVFRGIGESLRNIF